VHVFFLYLEVATSHESLRDKDGVLSGPGLLFVKYLLGLLSRHCWRRLLVCHGYCPQVRLVFFCH